MRFKRVITAALGTVAVSIGLGLAAPATPAHAAQGGITNDLGLPGHVWFKIGHQELMDTFNLNSLKACESTGLSHWNCLPISHSITNEFTAHPEAAGYWAEFYGPFPGGDQSGTW